VQEVNSPRAWSLIFSAVVLLSASPVLGLVLHNDADAPTDKPNDAVVGRWSTTASCVAVGEAGWTTTNYIITTQHQGGGNGDYVWLNDVKYVVAYGIGHSSADVRVARLETLDGHNANLTNFVQCYEVTTPDDDVHQDVVMGGYGKIRGTPLETGGTLYGYTWAGTNNQTQRWGTNRTDSSGSVGGAYPSSVLIGDFDAPASKDATIALYDSGGGWFIKSGSTWYVAGLSRSATDHGGESWFLPSDYIDAVRISSYATWIESKMSQPIPGDANRDGIVNLSDFTILKSNFGLTGGWSMGDFNEDGDINLQDFTILKANFGTGTSAGGEADAMVVPEPAALGLLAIGGAAMALVKRRRK